MPTGTAATPTSRPLWTPTTPPKQEQITFSEEYLSQLGFEFAHGKAPWPGNEVTQVTANVQADQEVYWKLWANRYAGDTMIEVIPVMGTKLALDGQRVRFELFDLQWIGFQFRPGWLDEDLHSAIFDLQEGVSDALERELQEKGWVPVAVTSNDEAVIVTVEGR